MTQHLAPTPPGYPPPEQAQCSKATGLSWRERVKAGFCAFYKFSGCMAVHERLAYRLGESHSSILLLHRVTDEIPGDGLTVSTEYFRRLCRMLQRSFNVAPLGEVVRMVSTGQRPDRRTIAITFDDCYYDNLPAARVLSEHGLPATFFIPTEFVGTDHVFPWDVALKKMPNLSWDDIKAMQALGHEIGSHTETHADFGVVDSDYAQVELRRSKATLEDRLGTPVRWFAYPFGGRDNFNPEYLPLVYATGYEACFSGYGGFVYPGMAGEVLPRVPVPSFRSLLNLELHLTGCLDFVYTLKRSLKF